MHVWPPLTAFMGADVSYDDLEEAAQAIHFEIYAAELEACLRAE